VQKYLKIFLLVVFSSAIGGAATRSDINVIEAAEKVRYLSQKIAKNYLYLYARPQHKGIKADIRTMLDELEKSFNTISSSTNDTNTKDILKYLEYNRDSIFALLKEKVNKENSFKMLDYSEVLLEGANLITQEHSYHFNPEEKMLIGIKKDEYLIERLGKFYMASSLGALSQSNRKKIEESKSELENGLKSIHKYNYPDKLQKRKKELMVFWRANKHFFEHSYDMFIPNLANIVSTYFEGLLTDFALYHSKSQ